MEINPLEQIKSDKRLSAILDGMKGMWNYDDEFLTIVLWHTDDYDLANEVITLYMQGDDNFSLEEALFECLTEDMFNNICLNSEFLSYSKCNELNHGR